MNPIGPVEEQLALLEDADLVGIGGPEELIGRQDEFDIDPIGIGPVGIDPGDPYIGPEGNPSLIGQGAYNPDGSVGFNPNYTMDQDAIDPGIVGPGEMMTRLESI